MTNPATEERRQPARQPQKLGIVDCDVHPSFYDGVNDLVPYLPIAWKHRLGLISFASASTYPGSQFMVPKNVMYLNVAGTLREDAVGPDGSFPAADPGFTAQHLLDQYKIDRAILSSNQIAGIGSLGIPDLAEVLASAYNDWQTERWLGVDERYRGSVLVAPQNPSGAAKEIDRVADRPGIVQVHFPLSNVLMGEPQYDPIYEAAERHGLPVFIHPHSTDGIYVRSPRLAGGPPTFYIEWHTLLSQVFAANLVSVLCQPVFQKFPGLKLVIAEGGFAWLADVLWRLDRNWKSMRDEVPWVKRAPSEYVFEHVRFTTQPFVEPERPEHVAAICDIMHAERTLLFSSDYPHWDFDNPFRALEDLPKDIRQRVFADNAVELYGERLL